MGLADEFPEMDFRGPQSLGGTPVHLHMYVPSGPSAASIDLTLGVAALEPRRPGGV